MEILFLGTAAAEGIPALFCRCETCLRAGKAGGRDIRSRCGFLVNGRLMLDFTPDIMLHKRAYNLDLAAVDTLCVTHSHTDHLNWADLCFRSKWYADIPGAAPLEVYANKKSCQVIQNGIEFEFRSREQDFMTIHEIAGGSIVKSGGLIITAFNAKHDPAENCLFYLVREGEKSFLQINDSGLPSEELERDLSKALKGRKLSAVSMDCTCGLEKGSTGHMGHAENIVLKERLLAAGLGDEKTQFFSTHFSHNGHGSHRQLGEILTPHFISPAYDGMILKL
jgi:phosphoribosyl 1,2-cyclic phosphate phosphodiesterase